MTRGRAGRRLGLRGRIAWGVFAAVLVSCATVSSIAYVHLSHVATRQFREQAQRQAESDLFGAASSANSTASADGSSLEDPRLDDVFQASFQSFFVADKTYAVVVLKPEPDGGYTFTSTGPGDDNGDTDTLHTTASKALVAATPFTEFVGGPSNVVTSREIGVDGRQWFAIGGVTATGTAPGYYRAPVVAVDYLDLAPLRAQISDYRTSFVVLTAAAALVAAAFAWLLAGLIQRPVRYAATAARAFGAGDRAVRLPVQGHDAVGDLAGSFNTMADELTATVSTLEESEARQRQFVADVSHELRTPVTALVAAASALDQPETRDRAAAIVAPQLRRLARLTDDLVETSLLDSGTVVLDPQAVDLLALCRDVAEHCGAPDDVSVRGTGDAFAEVDPRRIHTVLRNLVSNALRHGAPPVVVEVAGDAATVTVSVTDAGNGLPSDLGDAVFDRFVRGDRARTATGGVGSGLGLSLARDNAEVHGGTLTAGDGPGGGARFVLTVPRTARATVPEPAVASPAAAATRPGWWHHTFAGPGRRLAAAVGVVVVAALVVGLVLVWPSGGGRRASQPVASAPVSEFVRLFGPDVASAPLAVVATTRGAEGSTVDVVEAHSTSGLCTAVRVIPPSADPEPTGSCQPPVDGAIPQQVGGPGGSYTWISPTTGITWFGWYAVGATASTVQLRLDNQVVSSARTVGGAYVLAPLQESRAGCRTLVGLGPQGALQQTFYLDLRCDPAFASPAPGS